MLIKIMHFKPSLVKKKKKSVKSISKTALQTSKIQVESERGSIRENWKQQEQQYLEQ